MAKTATPRKKMPSKFVTIDNYRQFADKVVSEEAALEKAKKLLNSNTYYEFVGIYRLVKVVRRPITPMVIEEVK